MNDNAKSKGSLALAAPRVITIPANDPEIGRKLRVAAYARVSSNSDDQAHSFAAQNAYFSKLIAGNPNWELADIYADKGVTGTSIDKREDFLRMMEDCRKGALTASSSSPSLASGATRRRAWRQYANWQDSASASCSRNRRSTQQKAPVRCLPRSSQR